MTKWQRDQAQRSFSLVLRAHLQRIEALEEILAARELGLRRAWQEIEREREHRLALERRVAVLERQLARSAPARVPAATAARRLGLSAGSVRRLIEAGDLQGAALRLPDRERRAWVVESADLERFERESGAVGAAGTATEAAAGHGASNTKG